MDFLPIVKVFHDDGVARFMVGGNLLVGFHHHLTLFLWAGNDAFNGLFQLHHGDDLGVFTGG